MKYGHFDDPRREYVVTRPDTPLPWLNYIGQDDFFGLCTNTAGGYSFWKDSRLRRLTRYRYNNIPYDYGRPLHLRKRRRDGVEPRLEAGQGRARRLRVPPRPRLYEDHRLQRRARGRAPLLRPHRAERGSMESDRPEQVEGAQGPAALFVPGILLLRGPQRHDQLSTHVVDRRGRGRGRRHLPQNRVPRAEEPLYPLRLHAPRRGFRHRPRRLRRDPRRTARGARTVRGEVLELEGLRLEPDRRARGRPRSGSRRGGELRLRPRLRGAGRPAQVRRALRDQQEARPRDRRQVTRSRGQWTRHSPSWANSGMGSCPISRPSSPTSTRRGC